MIRFSGVPAALVGLAMLNLIASCGSSTKPKIRCDGAACADGRQDMFIEAGSTDIQAVVPDAMLNLDAAIEALPRWDGQSGADGIFADAAPMDVTLPPDSSSSLDAAGVRDVGLDSPLPGPDAGMDSPAVLLDGGIDASFAGTGGASGTGGTTGTGGVTGSGGSTGTGGASVTGAAPGSGGTTGTGGSTGTGGTTARGGSTGTGGASGTGGTSSIVSDAGVCSGSRWSVSSSTSRMELAFGSGTDFPQYGVIDTSSGYARFVYGPSGGWGTSIILTPSFWTSDGVNHQGTSIDVHPDIRCDQLQVTFTGTLAGLAFTGILQVGAPGADQVTAHVEMTTTGTVPLATDRPGEAFKPVMLSSMHESDTIWDASSVTIASSSYAIPADGWLVPAPIAASHFGVVGGNSTWKTAAPTVIIDLSGVSSPLVTGWITSSSDPNDDNLGVWVSASQVLTSWAYDITVAKAQ